PELIVSNPGISAAFFHCNPDTFDLDKVISRPVPVSSERMREVSIFLDMALQNAQFHTRWLEHDLLNLSIIRSIYGSVVVIEHAAHEGVPFGKLLSGAWIVTVGTFVGLQGIGGGPLLFLAVAAGILAVGAPVVMLHAIDKGLIHAVERAWGRKTRRHQWDRGQLRERERGGGHKLVVSDVPLLARLPPQQSNLRRHRAWSFAHSCPATISD